MCDPLQLPLNLNYLNTEDTAMAWAFQQSVQYGGVTMLTNMDSGKCLKMVKRAENNCITLKTGIKREDRLHGSNNLVKYVLANNRDVIHKQRAKGDELETARLASHGRQQPGEADPR